MTEKGWLIPTMIVAANALAIILQWNDMPEVLPAHFDLQGNASGTMMRTTLSIYPLASAAICLISYLITLKLRKIQTGMIILTSGISLVVFLSTLVTLTSGSMPIFMLAEPVVLLAAIVASIVSIVRFR